MQSIRQLYDRTRLAPRRFKQQRTIIIHGLLRLPVLARKWVLESLGGGSWGMWVHFLPTLILFRASCNEPGLVDGAVARVEWV